MKRLKQPSLWAPIVLVVVLAAFPAVFPDELYYIGLGFLTFIFVTQAVSWNMVGGYAGQVSFGYAAFFGTAAYVTAILWSRYQWEPVLTLPLAGLAAVVVSLIVGLPCFRLLGPYFSIATIGVGEAARVLALNLDQVTGGASGLNLPLSVPSKPWFYWSGLALAVVAVSVSAWMRASRVGLGLFVVYFSYIHPDQVFGFDLSIGMVLMGVIGGVGTLWGPVLGAAIYFPIRQLLLTQSNLVAFNLLVYGGLLIAIILFEPGGLLGLIRRVARR